MNPNTFWSLIKTSQKNLTNLELYEQADALMYLLAKESLDTICDFHLRLTRLQEELSTAHTIAVASTITKSDELLSAHTIKGFANWVIAHGEEHYNKARQDSTYLFTLRDEKKYIYLQDLNFVAGGAYYEKMERKGLDADDWGGLIYRYRMQELEKIIPSSNKDQSLER